MTVEELEERMRVANHERSDENLSSVTEGYIQYAFEDGKVLVVTKKGKMVTVELENLGLRVIIGYTSSGHIKGPIVTSVIPLEDLMILVASVDKMDGIIFNRGDDSFAYLDERICERYMAGIDGVKNPVEIVGRLLERYQIIGIEDEL